MFLLTDKTVTKGVHMSLYTFSKKQFQINALTYGTET